jgi:formiminoglutamase
MNDPRDANPEPPEPMTSNPAAWLTVRRGRAPLLLCMPHTGTEVPQEFATGFLSPWLTVKDTDWHVEKLYAFAERLDASLVRTAISRSVIDPNRDPSGVSLYPGQTTTELCPTTTFDGEPLYRAGAVPGGAQISARRAAYFEPYHRAISEELARLSAAHPRVVLYDCHSIRSRIPRLFTGTLPHYNLGTFSGASCARSLSERIEAVCDAAAFTRVTNGRFKGGYTTRHYGQPERGVHAVQMELACRGYLREPESAVDASNWPVGWDEGFAEPMRASLERILGACLEFAAARND